MKSRELRVNNVDSWIRLPGLNACRWVNGVLCSLDVVPFRGKRLEVGCLGSCRRQLNAVRSPYPETTSITIVLPKQ